MITVEEAYTPGPDGQIDMNKFRQFAAQQEALLNNMRATTQLSPELTYLQNNPDVLYDVGAQMANPNLVFDAAIIDGKTGKERAVEAAARAHFLDYGQSEGRNSFGMQDALGNPLSSFVNGMPPLSTDPIQTAPFPINTVTAPTETFNQTTGQDVQTNMTGPTNYGPAPLPGQLPGYSFTGNPDFYANALGTMGGLLDDTSAYYAGQVPAAPTTAVQTGGYNFPELAMYPNANYAAGISPFIFTG